MAGQHVAMVGYGCVLPAGRLAPVAARFWAIDG